MPAAVPHTQGSFCKHMQSDPQMTHICLEFWEGKEWQGMVWFQRSRRQKQGHRITELRQPCGVQTLCVSYLPTKAGEESRAQVSRRADLVQAPLHRMLSPQHKLLQCLAAANGPGLLLLQHQLCCSRGLPSAPLLLRCRMRSSGRAFFRARPCVSHVISQTSCLGIPGYSGDCVSRGRRW